MMQQFNFWVYTLKELKPDTQSICTPIFIAAAFSVAKMWTQSKVSVDGRIGK